MPSKLVDEIDLYLAMSLGLVVIASMLYVLVKLLGWSKKKALPRSGEPLFNAMSVSLVALIGMVMPLEIELIEVWNRFKNSALMVIGEIDLLVLTCVGMVAIVILAFALTRYSWAGVSRR